MAAVVALAAAGCATTAGPLQPVLAARSKPVISVQGLNFKDLNASGSLEPYEDWRLPAQARAADLVEDGNAYRATPPLTGDESRVAEVQDVPWPKLLEPVDDLPPATIVTSVRRERGRLAVRGVSHDNGPIVKVTVNGQPASILSANAGVVDWHITLEAPALQVVAGARDEAGNVEQTPHVYRLEAPDNGH